MRMDLPFHATSAKPPERDLPSSVLAEGSTALKRLASTVEFAWLLAALCYFFQYVLRAAPAVMMPQLGDAFDVSAAGVASLVGLFYYGYAPFSLVAGTALDRFGPMRIIPIGAAAVGVGALLFGTGNLALAIIGRFLQGAGGVFAMVGAMYIAVNDFPASRAATMVGVTQMFGASGGSVGQFAVGPMLAAGVAWSSFFIWMGLAGLAIAVALLIFLPKQKPWKQQDDWLRGAARSIARVFKNPQTILCGLIAGLFFIPTTVFDMIWGVRFLQEAHGFDYREAVIRSATVPLGWLIGSPLMGLLSDRLGSRKPVIVGAGCGLILSLAWILYGRPGLIPPYVAGLSTGIMSGAAMLLYTVGKEVNPPELGGTVAGAISFLVFLFSAVLNVVFGRIIQNISGGSPLALEHYQATFQPLLYGIGLAILLTLALKETGRQPTSSAPGSC
jgi:sugar phosphate permease